MLSRLMLTLKPCGAQAVVAKAIEHYGRVDILINNGWRDLDETF